MIRYYLSEMAVSDRHGGGLTIHRVLGPRLDEIRRFVTIGRFALERPAARPLADRCDPIVFWSDAPAARRRFGTRPLQVWDRIAWGARIRRVAARLRADAATDPDGWWFLCPQWQWVPRVWNGAAAPVSSRYVTWVMDDHVVRYQGGRWEYPPDYRPVFERHLRQAAHVFVISPAMGDLYRAEFGVESTVLFGGVDTVRPPVPPSPSGEPVRLGYFGAVGLWQLDPLVQLAAVLPSVGGTLDVYSVDPLPPELDRPGVTHHGSLAPDRVAEVMARCDAVVLPISFRDDQRNFTDLNIATKMSELLASGTVTLVVGPTHAAMVRYLKPHDAVVIVETDDREAVRTAVAACRDSTARGRLIANARRLVRDELSTAVMRGRWDQVVDRLTAGL